MKLYWSLAVFACVCLAAAAVWMGALNQDEGVYLYAANLVTEGKFLYADFGYTQGPVLPLVYSWFAWIWKGWGLLGARVFTLSIGLMAVVVFAVTAAELAGANAANRDDRSCAKSVAALTVVFLLGCNLYHLYYIAIPKTYALASLFVALGCLQLVRGGVGREAGSAAHSRAFLFAGVLFAFAAGTRISLGAILAVVGCWLLLRREWRPLVWFCVGGFLALALVYGPFLLDRSALAGLVAAQKYHAARGGFDAVWVVGSLSRLVRWYLPLFIVLGLGVSATLVGGREAEGVKRRPGGHWLLLFSFLAVFAVQMLAPFPYEDYQVPIMGLVAVGAAVLFAAMPSFVPARAMLLVTGLAFATAFGSPLLEQWSTDGQDRFWSLKKEKTELALLRETARRLEALDPGGDELFTQDLYLAIETRRKVPDGLEMGPFAMVGDADWRKLVKRAPCRIAALSGYTFAIDPPACNERPLGQQLDYWGEVRRNYELQFKVPRFGQGSTPLMVLKAK